MSYKPVDTAITIVVGPAIDDTDFKSLEEAIAYNAAGMDVSLIVEKTDGTTAVTAITLTTGGTSDWTHKDGGYYEIEVTAAQNIEEGIGYVRGVCTGVLPFESAHYNIVKANVYDSWVKGTDVLQVDITQLGGVTQSLTDLKDFADAGYNPGTNKITGTTDMRGTDSANTTVPDAAGVAPTAAEIKTEVEQAGSSLAQILADTGELQTDWVNGGRLDLILDIIAADTTTDIPALINALNDISTANVNTEVSDVLKTDVISEPAQGAPPVTPTFEEMVAYLYFKLRNKSETTSTEDALYDDAGTTKLMKAAVSDNGTTFTKAEYVSGA